MTKTLTKYIVVGGLSTGLLSLIVGSDAKVSSFNHAARVDAYLPEIALDTPVTNGATVLPYQFEDQSTGDPLNYPNSGGLLLNNPSNVKTDVEYDPATGNYNINQTVGGMNYRPPTYMDNEEYQDYMFKKQVKKYWNARSDAETQNNSNKPTIPKLNVGGEIFDRIFGGNTVDIRPNGSAELIFAYNGTKTENPAIPVRNRKVNTFDFNERIQLNVVGKIGTKLSLTTSYNTEAMFDFENQMKLAYTGEEDDIIKKIEAGNVSMPLNGSLITGSQTLFGVKTQLQFGRLTVTGLISQQKGKKSEVEVTGGAQISKFEVAGDNYEFNKHFFLAQYFRDQFNTALAGLPFINSGVNINRIEVWVSNTNTSTNDIRAVVSFSELAEDVAHIPVNQQSYITDNQPTTLPFNSQNNLYANMIADSSVRATNTTVSKINTLSGNTLKQTINFELVASARKLQPSEYTLNSKLGFISLNQQLNPDQTLSVAYQYTLNGSVYQVGEFSDGGISAPQALFTKMLKSTATNTKHPMWNLMMKNVYSIGSYQINPKDFKLNVLYNNLQTGTDINYLPVPAAETAIQGKTLIQVLNLDRLNQQNDQIADGVFDFIDGVTINANNGRVIFPVVEPFGDFLRSKFQNNPALANSYVFDQLYDSTRTVAQQFPQLNRFKLRGQYQSSSSSEISLGAPNVPQGSVTVTAGGIQLAENVDYTVDYTLGRVKIINDGILNSGTPIKIALESNALFAIQQKTLLATHLDYMINKDFNIGGTVMNLTERPITQKVNIGDEAISNTIVGLDGNYRTEAPFLTRFVDKIPFIDTKEMSTITAAAEYAYLIPGHSKAIGKAGNSYIDDFEGSQSTIDLRSQSSWVLASTPQGQAGPGTSNLFPEGDLADSLPYGYNRAKLAWYVIDPLFLRQTTGLTPGNISDNDMSHNFAREVPETEVFPNRPVPNGVPPNIATFDLAYYPNERGPYNYDAAPVPGISAGLDANGNLNDPETRWGGIMRSIQTNDFEAANVEYIQFWLMDPFNSDNSTPHSTGDLYFNIGNVSEDILRDNYKSAENGLPTSINPAATVTTDWGQVPAVQPLLNTFNNDPVERPFQDVGLDGLGTATSVTEQSFFSSYISSLPAAGVSPAGVTSINSDPSADDFHYFRGSDFDGANVKTLERYKNFNGMENNSRTTEQSPESYPTSASLTPNIEDINRDNNLSTAESYYQYHISLKQNDFAAGVGYNYITDVFSTNGQNIKNGTSKPIKWYQFKIPIKTPEAKIGSIENFQSIRFIRMFLKNVDKPVVLRFARLELVRGEWRKYGFDLIQPGIYIPNDEANTLFNIAAVNIEENGSRQPVNYVLPPNITREINAASANLLALNEQALALTVCNLKDGDSRAAFKNTDLDVRSYKKLKMYIHSEASTNTSDALNNNDLRVFVRLGTDYTDNYYEYEIPLIVTPAGYYNGTNVDDQYRVWPEANDMILEFGKLQAAKQQRNLTGANITSEYTVFDGSRKITIKGNPNLSAVKTLMIGIRNPKKMGINNEDDGLPKCGQIWVNELRLSDFDEQGGGAANARVTAKLADFGTLSLSGNYYAPGFGSIENKVSERKRATLKQYDITSSFELGKFLPEAANINIPMYVGYSETFLTPQYNPLDPDILLAPVLKDPTISAAVRDSIRKITQDYTLRRSINFTNVKKGKGKNSKKSHIYDIENLAASYSFNEIFKRNVNLEYDSTRNYKAGIIYSYSPTPKNIKPFAKNKLVQSKYLLLIKDVNFYLFPNKLGFSTDVERGYNTAKTRDITEGEMLVIPTFNKRFTMNRNYDLKYDLTKALKFDFTATNEGRILEPQGAIDTREEKDTLRNNFLGLGKTTQYNHQANVNYAIPINKVPLLDFTTASVRYTGTYNWVRAPFNADSLGNTIQNSQAIQWTGQMNMVTLYNKIPYLKKINQKGNKNTSNKNSKTPPPPAKGKGAAPVDSTKKEKKDPSQVLMYVARTIMSLKNVNITYATNQGTILPGYGQFTNMMGMDGNFAGPTPGFIFGDQKDIREEAVEKNWLVKTQSLNIPFVRTSSQNLNIRANVEPLPDFKIEVTGVRTRSKSQNEFFRWKTNDTLADGTITDHFKSESPMETGNFSMSFLTFGTSFKDGDATFKKFLDARAEVSSRLGAENDSSQSVINGYAEGYNATSQDVLIPAFIAAYSNKNPISVGLSAFPKLPKPNWRITYDGLSKIEAIKKRFKSITLSHAYRSTYNVSGYTSNLLFTDPDNDGYTATKEAVSSISSNRNYLAKDLINTVTVSEQWSPLIKVDITLHNSVLVNFEYKKDRNLSLGLTSKTVTEVGGREAVVGLGYRIKDLSLGKRFQIKGKPIKSDLNLKSDLSFRKNETIIRRIVEEVSQSTGGTNIISIKVSADYVINERINIRLFYDRIINKPVVSNSFPTTNTNAGISLRLTLSN
ncbi:MAG: cell surface protein SprA [Bacteroidota bacterium]